jgi:hypothetical protein
MTPFPLLHATTHAPTFILIATGPSPILDGPDARSLPGTQRAARSATSSPGLLQLAELVMTRGIRKTFRKANLSSDVGFVGSLSDGAPPKSSPSYHLAIRTPRLSSSRSLPISAPTKERHPGREGSLMAKPGRRRGQSWRGCGRAKKINFDWSEASPPMRQVIAREQLPRQPVYTRIASERKRERS